MTRAQLLECLMTMTAPRRTVETLTRAFGEDWKEAMQGLIDLNIVHLWWRGDYQSFYVVKPWR